MSAPDIRAARRYATALFETAQKNNCLKTVEDNLDDVVQLLTDSPAFRQMWESPLVPSGRKREVLVKALTNSVHPITLAFLRLLVDKRREDNLVTIRHEIHEMADSYNHLIRAEATFAVTPTDAERKALEKSLEQRTGENVELSVRVDPSILGGVVVKMRDTIVDGSVRGTLERLREQLLQEA